MKENQQVAVIDSQNQDDDSEELPEEEMDSKEAREFGERLCERKAGDWSIAQQRDETAKTAINIMLANIYISVGDISDEAIIPETRRSTLEVHPEFSEASHSKSSIPHPKTDFSKHHAASR